MKTIYVLLLLLICGCATDTGTRLTFDAKEPEWQDNVYIVLPIGFNTAYLHAQLGYITENGIRKTTCVLIENETE